MQDGAWLSLADETLPFLAFICKEIRYNLDLPSSNLRRQGRLVLL